jgi:hypothetical protein
MLCSTGGLKPCTSGLQFGCSATARLKACPVRLPGTPAYPIVPGLAGGLGRSGGGIGGTSGGGTGCASGGG